MSLLNGPMEFEGTLLCYRVVGLFGPVDMGGGGGGQGYSCFQSQVLVGKRSRFRQKQYKNKYCLILSLQTMSVMRKVAMRGGRGTFAVLRSKDRFWVLSRPGLRAHSTHGPSPLEGIAQRWRRLNMFKWGAPTLALGGMIGEARSIPL